MDPDANLQEQEALITSAHPGAMAGVVFSSARMRELNAALRAWLATGGFEPDWSKAPRAAKRYGR